MSVCLCVCTSTERSSLTWFLYSSISGSALSCSCFISDRTFANKFALEGREGQRSVVGGRGGREDRIREVGLRVE